MPKVSPPPVIRLRGVRHNNLKNLDLDLPLRRLIVITGLSGSGKSSLAFDTLFAEGQRRYLETFSPYARQFFDRMDKPQADSIEGIPPAIAIEQRNTVRTTRSTVGTMTEICDYMKLLWSHLGLLYCRQCGQLVRRDPPQRIWEAVRIPDRGGPNSASAAPPREVLITFDLPLSSKLSLAESLALVASQGYQRLLLDNQPARLEDALPRLNELKPALLTLVQDRLTLTETHRARFIEACEQAYHFGKGKLAVRPIQAAADPATVVAGPVWRFSERFHCAACELEYREPTPALFSFNHPLGACPTCRGFGRTITIDYEAAMPDHRRTLAEGVVKPWLTGISAECQQDLLKFCRARGVPIHVPFSQLEEKWREWVIQGDPGYGTDPKHEWPHAWYGVKGYFRWLESKAYKMHVRVLLSRYRRYQVCPVCQGTRFQPDALLFRVALGAGDPARGASKAGPRPPSALPRSLTLADFYRLPIRDALALVEELRASRRGGSSDPLELPLAEVRARLGYLVEVGLGYLTLDRPTRSLSGGETERVNLTTCLGTRLVNTLFVLDEPSVGLHPRDTARLVRILERLRDAGNTVVVVEHEAGVMRAADQLVDLGPGRGETGGHVVFQGTFARMLKSRVSLTGHYLSGRKRVEVPERRTVEGLRPSATASAKRKGAPDRPGPRLGAETRPCLRLSHAQRHNLRDLTVEIPLGRLVCISGVSGSGKTTLVREVLLPALEARLKAAAAAALTSTQDGEEGELSAVTESADPEPGLEGWESLGRVVLVDQSSLGKTPRSNPAVYVGAFDDIRELFAQSEAARQRGLGASAFSFNSSRGQCERCRGAGFEKIEMQFLSDVFIRCPDCQGRRYRPHVLEVAIRPAGGERAARPPLSIADLLDATVDEAISFLAGFGDSRPARRAVLKLSLVQEIGLGYLRLGQPINTLSGGESQRLKLISHLAEAPAATQARPSKPPPERGPAAPTPGAREIPAVKPTLFLFDEPTTGLHFDDVRVLLRVLERLVDGGHSVVVIEHNLDLIRCADWVIDLGPEAGDGGGRLVAQGPPESIAACSASHTGAVLRGK